MNQSRNEFGNVRNKRGYQGGQLVGLSEGHPPGFVSSTRRIRSRTVSSFAMMEAYVSIVPSPPTAATGTFVPTSLAAFRSDSKDAYASIPSFKVARFADTPDRIKKTKAHEMTDKIITLRDPIPTSIPVEQSFVADWSNFSRGGASMQTGSDSDSFSESDESDENAYTMGGEQTDLRSAPPAEERKPGFLARIMNPGQSSSSTTQDAATPTTPAQPDAQQPETTDTPPLRGVADRVTQIDSSAAAREIVTAISSVTRSSSGDSIADLLDQIASALRGIEVASRAAARAPTQPVPTQTPPPPLSAPRAQSYDDRVQSQRDNATKEYERPQLDEDRRGDRNQDLIRDR